MAKRKFELPGIQDLSKEQEAVRALPKDGQHLIVGGPGTGKTVVALVRARRHAREKDDYVFLVFNHLLHRASGQLFGDGLSGSTWEAWFGERFESVTGNALPHKPPAKPGGYRPIDWDGVTKVISESGTSRLIVDAPFLVIDEGQDMPPQFYEALVGLGFERFFVAADQNQQIHDEHSNRRDIETALAIDTAAVIELKRNYRNSGAVARLARAFYTGDPASPPVDLPSNSPPRGPGGKGVRGPSALLCDYAPGRFENVCRRIVKIVDRDPATLVGVIAPNNEVRRRYFDRLTAAADGLRQGDELDNAAPCIETFFGRRRPDVRFDEGGILVINAQACKGLEFDVAVLADIDRHHAPSGDLDAVRKRFYVMVARAREQVILLRQRGVDSPIEGILPDDSDVLRRKDVV